MPVRAEREKTMKTIGVKGKNGRKNGNGGLKKLMTAALCFTVLFGCIVFSGCNGSAADPEANGAKDYEVDLYYVNQAYIDGGDESLGRFKPALEKTITAAPADIYTETLKALSETPEKDGYATMLKDITINGAALDQDGKTVVVDFASKGLTGGSMEETFLIEQIVRTLEDSFDVAKQVKFTVDGAPAETLMGHMDTSVPYGITEVDNGIGKDVEMVMPLYE